MKANHDVSSPGSLRRYAACCLVLAGNLSMLPFAPADAAPNVVVWDTGSRLTELKDSENRAGWKAVPSELFALEADPAKASSDPGYSGREYSFKGDAVVENAAVTAVFWSAKGRVVLYSNPTVAPGRKIIAELVPLPVVVSDAPQPIRRCEIIRNASDEVVLKVSFTEKAAPEISASFVFGRNEIVEIKPGLRMKGVRLFTPIEYGVVPGFIGDDLIFSPADYATTNAISLPPENLFVALLKGEAQQLVLTWPKGKQQISLRLAEISGQPVFESIDFNADGQSFYVASLNAPGIWHREELKPAYLEKDTGSTWKRPFAAKWKTQLKESGVRTTFTFRETKGSVWRGVAGSYTYPVWFEGENAHFHLSKKVPPKGDSITYFLEGQNTPITVNTPIDIMKSTLGRQVCEPILDVAGQKLRTHHRRGGDGVHRACTCGCTEAIQALFEAGQEVAKKEHVRDALGDMNYFVDCHVERIEEYRRFATAMIQFLETKASEAPELKSFLENLGQIAQQIPQEYNVQKENMKSKEHADDLTRRTMELTGNRSTNNLAAYMDLLKAWRAMGGAQDYVVAQCHMITRKLFQEAGYGCVSDAKAVAVAQEVRARCRQVLRNPDGYEIWANY